MFSNEFSLPYLTRVEPETTAAMARTIGELKSDITVPYGVNVLWDTVASFDLAKAVDGLFVREIFSGVYASGFGVWDTNTGESIRHQHRIGAGHVKTLFNIVPEAVVYMGDRDLYSIAKSTVFNHRPDALCVSNVQEQLSIADGCVTATTFKKDGVFENFVDQDRVTRFMDKVNSFR